MFHSLTEIPPSAEVHFYPRFFNIPYVDYGMLDIHDDANIKGLLNLDNCQNTFFIILILFSMNWSEFWFSDKYLAPPTSNAKNIIISTLLIYSYNDTIFS